MKRRIRLTENDIRRIVNRSVRRVLKEATPISIAPSDDEIEITDNEISTMWNNGIRYVGDIRKIRMKYSDDEIRSIFTEAIAFSSKPWQLERILNNYFGIDGSVL